MPFFLVRPAGRTTNGCKSRDGPTGETSQRPARVSIARWNLKEAVAKHRTDEQEVDKRQGTRMSGPKYAKSETCTESCQVDRPVISVKVVRITRGGLHPSGKETYQR